MPTVAAPADAAVAPGTVPTSTAPSAAPAVGPADAAALAGLTVVVEPTRMAAAAPVTGAPADAAVPSGPTAAADVGPAAAAAETAVPAPATGSGAQDQATRDGAAGAPAQPTPAAPAPDTPDVVPPVPTQPAGTGPVPTTAATSPAAAVEGTTGTAAAQPVGAQVARQVAVLRGAADGSHTMTLVLTPETLGPVEVKVTVSNGTLDLTLRGAHEHGRSALLDALPDLRRDLEQAGLSVTSAEVDRDTGGSRFSDRSAQYGDRQQGFGDRGGQSRSDSGSRPWPGAADTSGGPTPPSQRTASSGLDVRA
jgi:flagellar hook-length control protein FliK